MLRACANDFINVSCSEDTALYYEKCRCSTLSVRLSTCNTPIRHNCPGLNPVHVSVYLYSAIQSVSVTWKLTVVYLYQERNITQIRPKEALLFLRNGNFIAERHFHSCYIHMEATGGNLIWFIFPLSFPFSSMPCLALYRTVWLKW
jgi:hypothetical protein